MIDDLLEKHRLHWEKILQRSYPGLGWPTRTVQIKHGKHTAGREPYAAILSHDPDIDFDDVFGKLNRRSNRLEKAVEDRKELTGGRWITVGAGEGTGEGDDHKGHPVYIVPTSGGAHVVVGGVGGKLNGMRLTRIKTEEEYKHHSQARAKERKHAQRLRDELEYNRLGAEAYEKQQAESESVAAAKKSKTVEAEKSFVAAVAKMQGVDPKKFEVPESALEGVSDRGQERVKEKAHQASVRWATQTAKNLENAVVGIYTDLTANQLGEVPIADIARAQTGDTGLGYQSPVHAMAVANGLTPEGQSDIAKDARWRSLLDRTGGDVAEAHKRMAAGDSMQAAARAAREEDKSTVGRAAQEEAGPAATRELPTAPTPSDMGEAVSVLAARKAMLQARKALEEQSPGMAEVENAGTIPRGLMVVGQDSPESADLETQVRNSIEDGARRTLMATMVKTSDDLERASGSLAQHYGVGAVSTLNTISQGIDGSSIDPVTMDILGAAGAAQVLAAKWERALSPEDRAKLKDTMAAQHVATQEGIATTGLKRSAQYLDEAENIGEDAEPKTEEEVEAAIAHMSQKADLLSMAREALGVARGRIEALGALNHALMSSASGRLLISLGTMSNKDAAERAFALGLEKPSLYDTDGKIVDEGDFTVHSDGEARTLEIHKSGIEKLAPQSDPDRMARAKLSSEIKNGEQDEAGWLPAGISRRPATSFELDPLVQQSTDHALTISNDDDLPMMEKRLREHIGARIQAGADASTIASDITSAETMAGLDLTPEAELAYRHACANVAPSYFDHVRQTLAEDAKAGMDPEQVAEKKKRLTKTTSPEFQSAFEAHQAAVRAKIEGYADDFIAAERAAGRLDEEDATLDRQRIPLNDATQDSLYQATLLDPRAANGFLPMADVDTGAVRSWALEHILGVKPGEQDDTIRSNVSPEEAEVYRKWQAFKGQHGGGVYQAIQQEMLARHEQDAGGSMFEEESPTSAPSLATVDLSNDIAVIQAARQNASKLGYKMQVDPKTGRMAFLELQDGQVFYSVGSGGAEVRHSPLTNQTIAAVARERIKKHLRGEWMSTSAGRPTVAESGFNPDTVSTTSNRWTMFVKHMGGPTRAIAAVQAKMRGALNEKFTGIYQQTTGKKLGYAHKRLDDAHTFALAVERPEAIEHERAEERSRYAAVGKGRSGKFVAGERKARAKREKMAQEEAQGGLLSESSKGEFVTDVTHVSLGHAVEGALRGMMPYINTSAPTEAAGDITMSGNAAPRQRAVKLIRKFKRLALALGTGTGKTIVGMGAFTDARAHGEATRGIFVVPSNIQAQFGSEFARFRDPKIPLTWHSDTTATPEERREAMSDPGIHAVVMTPEAMREDVTNAVAHDLGMTRQEAGQHLLSLPDAESDKIIHNALIKRKWNWEFCMSDEGHRMLSRVGKPDALMAKVSDAVARKSRYFVHSSVSGDMSLLVDSRGVVERLTIAQLSDRYNVGVGEIKNGLEELRVRCFDFNTNEMSWSPVTAIHKFNASRKRCFEIIGAYNKRIVVTEDHSMYVWREGKIELVYGSDVRMTDELIVETRTQSPSSQCNDTLNLLDYMRGTNAIAYGDFPEIDEYEYQARYRYRNRGKHGPYLPIEDVFAKGCDQSLIKRVVSIRGDSGSNPIIDLKSIAFLIGLYLGDGCLTRHSIQLTMHSREVDEIVAEIKKIDGVRVHANKKKGGDAWDIIIGCFPIVCLFRKWFGNQKAATKRIPNEIFMASPEVQSEVMRGYIYSDGHIDKHHVNITSCSYDLLMDASVLLNFMGVTSAIAKRKPPTRIRGNSFDNGGDSYDLTFTDGSEEHGTWASSGVRGVTFYKRTGKYRAYLFVRGKRIEAGWYWNLEDAAAARLAAERAVYGGETRNRKRSLAIAISNSAARVVIKSIREVEEEFVYDISVAGTENFLANGILTHNTADVVKNDASEAFSVLSKIAPDKYNEGNRAAFIRKFGRGTLSARLALRQELEPYMYSAGMDLGIKSNRSRHMLPMTESQGVDYNRIQQAYRRGRAAVAMRDWPAVRRAIDILAPDHFKPEDNPSQEELRTMARSMSALKATAENRVVNLHRDSAKMGWISNYTKEHAGEPTVIFAHNLEAHRTIVQRLRAEGHKVSIIRGGMSPDQKEKEKLRFMHGDTDIMVSTDAGAMGANLQRGYHMILYDIPHTSMVDQQRQGRCIRQGQKNFVSVHQLVTDCPYERRASRRLERKQKLRETFSNPAEELDDTGLARQINNLHVHELGEQYGHSGAPELNERRAA